MAGDPPTASDLNVLLVGVGRWGEHHLRVLRELGIGTWVAARSAERRDWAIAQGVEPARVLSDYRDALDAVDAVDVVTPADSHAPIATTSLEHGRHVLVEKPLAMTAEEGRRLETVAARVGRVLQVGHIYRFHPVTAALQAVLRAERLGRIRFATGRFAGFKRPRTDVGITQTDAMHWFDLFAYLFDRRASAVTSVQRDHLGRGLDDYSVSVVRYGDIEATIEADYFTPGTHRVCTVVGDRATLVADYGANRLVLHAGEHHAHEGQWRADAGAVEDIPIAGGEPLCLEIASFLAACAEGRPAAVSADAGVHALEIVEAAARSARTAQTVSVHPEIAEHRARP